MAPQGSAPLHRALLVYAGPGEDIILLEMPVGEQASSDPQRPLFAVVEMLTDESVESTTFDGQQAAWVGDRCLMWEAEGINFILGGTGLDLAEAIRIAQSLR